jgi:DNA repair exonuclease SbcCD ATPase subunit
MPDTPLTEAELKRIEEYCNKIPKHWEHRHQTNTADATVEDYAYLGPGRRIFADYASVVFMCAARTDLPALVAEVRRLRADLEHLEKVESDYETDKDAYVWGVNRIAELEADLEQRDAEFRSLSDINDELQADLEQAAKDWRPGPEPKSLEAFRAVGGWPNYPDWLKRVRERDGR